MKKGLCIYHANCNDGFAAALAVWKKYGDDWDYLPMQYGDEIDDPYDLTIAFDDDDPLHPSLYETVMLVDFSLPRDYMIKLSKLTNLLVIDHHKTAQEACEGLDFCKFNLNMAGCTATWQYLFPHEPCPRLLECIADRDLWRFELPETEEICAGLALYDRSFEVWNTFLENDLNFTSLMSEGSVILRVQKKATKVFVEQWKNNPRMAHIDVFAVPIANCTDLISERIGSLSEGWDFAIGYFETDKKRVFSLRTRKDDIDCGLIAKQYGGGGHPGAAGFSVDLCNVDPEMSPSFFRRVSDHVKKNA